MRADGWPSAVLLATTIASGWSWPCCDRVVVPTRKLDERIRIEIVDVERTRGDRHGNEATS